MRWGLKGRSALLLLCLVWGVSFGRTTLSGIDCAWAGPLPSSDKRFVFVGVNAQVPPCTTCSDSYYQILNQFSEASVNDITQNYGYAFMTKYHAKWCLERQFEDAKRLKKLNPKIKTFIYFNATLAFFQSDLYDEINQHENWILHLAGNPGPSGRVPFKTFGYWLDVSDAGFQAWYVDQIAKWLYMPDSYGNQVFDGVFFDNAQLYNPGCNGNATPGCDRITTLVQQVGMNKLYALNDGLTKLFADTKKAVGTDKLVIYNGVENFVWTIQKSVALLSVTDGATNEQFGMFGAEVSKSDMLQYINLCYQYPTKYFFQKVNIPATITGEVRNRVLRKTYGCFLMGHNPGYTYFKVGENYTVEGELPAAGYDPKEVDIDFGKPVNNYYTTSNGLLRRDFQNGTVLVNLDGKPLSMTVGRDYQLYNGNFPGAVYKNGQSITVPAGDACFLKFQRPSVPPDDILSGPYQGGDGDSGKLLRSFSAISYLLKD